MEDKGVTSMMVLGMGNPVMDMVVTVDRELLDKYGLKLNNAILAEFHHQPLYEEIKSFPSLQYVAGGATQNSIRVCAALLQQKNATAYIGCIGLDNVGQKMRDLASSAGIKGLYANSKNPTGICAVCVKDSERSLCTNLSAANDFPPLFVTEPEPKRAIEETPIIYSSGYFCTVAPTVMVDVATKCSETNRVYCLNLAAPFIVSIFKETVEKLLPLCDFIFGNEAEFEEFGKSFNLGTEAISEIVAKVAALPKVNTKRPRVVLCTQGPNPTLLTEKWNDKAPRHQTYDVAPIEPSEIVDTNGAGDAFVGGFLAGLSRGLDEMRCVNLGHFSAGEIIRRSGCAFDFDKDVVVKMMAD